MEQAFNRFARLDNELTRCTPGTGLGLAISREILTEIDGSIEFTSDEKCIEVRIRLPLLVE
jgi:signal transduction histidine kinase